MEHNLKPFMQLPAFIHKIRHRIEDEQHWLTRRKLAVFGGTLVVIGISMGAFESGQSPPDSSAYTEIIKLTLPDSRLEPSPVVVDGRAGDNWHAVVVRSGQTLDSIFRKQGFSIALLHRILALNEDTKGLAKIRLGETFEFRKDANGDLLKMRYPLDEARYLLVRNENGQLSAEIQHREIIAEIYQTDGVINSSLFLAARKAGLSDPMIMKLAKIFGWDIDFVLDIRQGDRFMLVYEKLYREGEFLRDGNLLAATFINQGERFQAIYFEDDEVSAYYAPDGRAMRKAFLRAPLNFSYISSSFNPRRMHPVLKYIRPHNGIDYHAPRGTPVYAAGDGTVIRSDYSRVNGHHVFIQHANGIQTKYLHFTKRSVKKGQRVSQGQTIGYVGSTGLATGPHLHYEFVLNGVHRNPRTVSLPKVEPLKGARLKAFQAHAAPMLTQLSRLESTLLFAKHE